MTRRSLLIAVCLLSHSLSGAAVAWAAQAAPAAPDTTRHWTEAKRLIARGQYRDALQELEIILSLSPGDPWAETYKALCERRLSNATTFAVLTPEQAEALRQSLRQEEAMQRQAGIQRKALEKQVQKEQSKWDREVKALTEATAKQREAAARAQQAAIQQRRRDVEARRKQMTKQLAAAQAPAPAASAPLPTSQPTLFVPEAVATPGAPAAAVSPAPAGPQSMASPVSAAPQETLSVPEEAEAPALPEPAPVRQPQAPLPPRAVQIFGDQMNVSPNRNLAIAEGNVRVAFSDGELTCDRLTYFTDTKDIYAQGHVYLTRGQDLIRGEMVHYNTTTKKGRVLEGTVRQGLWYEHGRVMEHLAEGVMRVKPGYLTSCDFEPPHFRFQGRRSTVFAKDDMIRSRHVALMVGEVPLFYFPWLSAAARQTPFFFIPGKKKPWEQFLLMGYRYELPVEHQTGILHADWRRTMGWGFGITHRMESQTYGNALVKLYYNEEPNSRELNPKATLPKGASLQRYRALFRYDGQPMPDTKVAADIQEFSDSQFKKDFLFRDEYTKEIAAGTDPGGEGSFVSLVTSDPHYSVHGFLRKRMNRFDDVIEAFPDLTVEVPPQPMGDTPLFIEAKTSVAALNHKRPNSEDDTDVVRVDWFEQLSYALNWFRPIEFTPKAGVRQTYYNKDKQGGAERPQGKRDVISGQVNAGWDASLKLFRIFPVSTNFLRLDINWLRHVLTPTIGYSYIHGPTVPNELLEFTAASGATNQLTFGLENKLQTKRLSGGKLNSVDVGRFLISVPYNFHGRGNEQGGRIGTWSFDLEAYPWSWMRLETDWSRPHLATGVRDETVTAWNVDLVVVGGRKDSLAQDAKPLADLQQTATGFVYSPTLIRRAFASGPQQTTFSMLPVGEWYLGLGHRFSQNDKTETVIETDWRLSEKWQIGMFHRYTWKEVTSTSDGISKRLNHFREFQYTLTRDLHDWIGELAYRVDREYGEEIFLTFILKAYPEMPVEFETGYHQPKIGSQSSPFSPLRGK